MWKSHLLSIMKDKFHCLPWIKKSSHATYVMFSLSSPNIILVLWVDCCNVICVAIFLDGIQIFSPMKASLVVCLDSVLCKVSSVLEIFTCHRKQSGIWGGMWRTWVKLQLIVTVSLAMSACHDSRVCWIPMHTAWNCRCMWRFSLDMQNDGRPFSQLTLVPLNHGYGWEVLLACSCEMS